MVVDHGKVVRFGNDVVQYTFDGMEYYVHGLLIYGTCEAGEMSVKKLHDYIITNGQVCFNRLRGNFACVIRKCTWGGDTYLFTDNSNMHCYYVCGDILATSYLELIDYCVEKGIHLTFDEKGVCEIMTLGRTLFDRTTIKEVKRSDLEKYYEFSNGVLNVKDKVLQPVGEMDTDVEEERLFLHELACSLNKEKYVQALTGGYDSRMVYACMSEIKPVHCFVSGDNKEDSDIVISQKVAKANNSESEVVAVEKPQVTQELIDELFAFSDGTVPFLDSGSIRIGYFQKHFANEGYRYLLTGDGGVLHKDWEWMQDLPFYNKKNTDLHRFYNQRIEFIKRENHFTQKYRRLHSEQKDRIIDGLRKYVKDTNTQSYDYLYYFVNGYRANYYTVPKHGIFTYAPLNERELVDYSYKQPRFDRFFYNLIRRNTTIANREIAKIPTIYGTTSSSEFRYIIRDIFFQAVDYAKKAVRLFGRKIFDKSFFCGNVVTWNIDKELREIAKTENIVQFGKDKEIIVNSVSNDVLTINEISALYLLLRIDRLLKQV